MRFVFAGCHTAIANFQHIRIIPVAGSGITFKSNLLVENLQNAKSAPVELAIETIADIGGCAP